VSINWGPWSETGMATCLVQQPISQGIKWFSPRFARQLLDIILRSDETVCMPLWIDWSLYAKKCLTRATPRFLADLIKENVASDFLAQQLQATEPEKRRLLLNQIIKNNVQTILGFQSSQELDENKGFFDAGMDSLMLVDLRNQLQLALGPAYTLTTADLFSHASIAQLTDYIAQLLKFNEFAPEKTSTANTLAQESNTEDAIAIIGLSCRFPGGANTPETYWDLLLQGFDAISDIPPDRWDINAYYDADLDKPGKMYTRKGAFLEGSIQAFDANFFGITPREAEMMDPQQRLLLEVTWEAFERAGYTPTMWRNSKTGVFVGVSTHDYGDLLAGSGVDNMNAYFGTGNAPSAAVGRLSYVFGLLGPNMAIDTACSSSLLATHLACQSLQRGESEMAIAGGVNLILSPATSVYFCKRHLLSVDGHCKTFDATADGYVRGEGCGIIVLKRLADAQRDGDRVLAVIRGSATNQDGASGGLTVPNGKAQQAVIEEALSNAKVHPAHVDVIEAHGTGTHLGDPIEIQALSKVFSTERKNPLYISSVKTNPCFTT